LGSSSAAAAAAATAAARPGEWRCGQLPAVVRDDVGDAEPGDDAQCDELGTGCHAEPDDRYVKKLFLGQSHMHKHTFD
jgi:hypothetical protein